MGTDCAGLGSEPSRGSSRRRHGAGGTGASGRSRQPETQTVPGVPATAVRLNKAYGLPAAARHGAARQIGQTHAIESAAEKTLWLKALGSIHAA